jgi:Macrocin-O-methyltransferase (TylF)
MRDLRIGDLASLQAPSTQNVPACSCSAPGHRDYARAGAFQVTIRCPPIVVLNALYPKVSTGGFVIIDDYGMIPACDRDVADFRPVPTLPSH